MAGNIDDDGTSYGLAALRCACTAWKHGNLLCLCYLQYGPDVLYSRGEYNAERFDLVVRGISGEESTREGIKMYLAFDFPLELLLESGIPGLNATFGHGWWCQALGDCVSWTCPSA
jgi:hypothetical protein